jgi:hypothetical protein
MYQISIAVSNSSIRRRAGVACSKRIVKLSEKTGIRSLTEFECRLFPPD